MNRYFAIAFCSGSVFFLAALARKCNLEKCVFALRVLRFLLVQRLRARPNQEGTLKKTERKRELKTQRKKNAADTPKIMKNIIFGAEMASKIFPGGVPPALGCLRRPLTRQLGAQMLQKSLPEAPRERKRQKTRGGPEVTRGARGGVQPRFGEVGGPRGVGGYNPPKENFWI